MKFYYGHRFYGHCRVFVGANYADQSHAEPLLLRLDLVSHSPTGFEWGYGGSGPAQLALAILADYFGWQQPADVVPIYQQFKWDAIATIGTDRFTITSECIEQWLAQQNFSAGSGLAPSAQMVSRPEPAPCVSDSQPRKGLL